jgi:hypothetical protein
MSARQSFLEHQDLLTCDGCRIPMSAVPRKSTEPGPEYFGYRMFECPECKKTLAAFGYGK